MILFEIMIIIDDDDADENDNSNNNPRITDDSTAEKVSCRDQKYMGDHCYHC